MTDTTSFIICPRCEGPIEVRRWSVAVADGVMGVETTVFSAASRADDDIAVCSACGSDEAMRQHETGEIVPVSAWPLENAHEFQMKFLFPILDGELS